MWALCSSWVALGMTMISKVVFESVASVRKAEGESMPSERYRSQPTSLWEYKNMQICYVHGLSHIAVKVLKSLNFFYDKTWWKKQNKIKQTQKPPNKQKTKTQITNKKLQSMHSPTPTKCGFHWNNILLQPLSIWAAISLVFHWGWIFIIYNSKMQALLEVTNCLNEWGGYEAKAYTTVSFEVLKYFTTSHTWRRMLEW